MPRQRLVRAHVDVQLIRARGAAALVGRHAVRRIGFTVVQRVGRGAAVDDLHGDVAPGGVEIGAEEAERGDLVAEAAVCVRACWAVVAGVGGGGVVGDGDVIVVVGRVGEGEEGRVDVGAGGWVIWAFIAGVGYNGVLVDSWARSRRGRTRETC